MQQALRERAPESLVLGTAGHIDHGKTELIRALTGVDTDRLPEEKRRGITIELGFAPLDLGDGLRLSVIDVPGHEGLVRTMVAGATGIDLLLLVVAADEGVMPQTREHLAICELLGLEHGVVALTKADRVDADVQELAAAEVEELMAGSALAGAAVIPVSAKTGAGLDALRAALQRIAGKAAARTPRQGPPRLAVDRAFAARGFGSVVTGTLVGGPLGVGDAVEILPAGLRARVRGLERFGERVQHAEPGARTAVNLQGVGVAELSRGSVVTRPDALAATDCFDAALHWLPEAPALDELVSVELLAGASERRARCGPIGAGALAPGGAGFARVHVEGEPLPLLPGDRFVLRGFARTATGGATLGGGRVLDVAPPRRRRSDPTLAAELELLSRGDPELVVPLRILRAGFAGVPRDTLLRETGFGPKTLDAALAAASKGERVLEAAVRVWIGAEALDALAERLLASLAAWHRREALRPGMPRGALAGSLPDNAAPGSFELALARLAAAGRIREEDDLVRLAEFAPRLSQEQEARAGHLRASAMAAGLEPPTPKEWAEELGIAIEPLRDLLAYLERDGSLVRAPGELWFDKGAVDELRERVVAHLRQHGAIATPAYKDLIGTSRKYAVPLMELFDGEGLSLRRGDQRVAKKPI